MYEICPKLIVTVSFEQISFTVVVFLLLTLNNEMPTRAIMNSNSQNFNGLTILNKM